jgi:hypothetical protein
MHGHPCTIRMELRRCVVCNMMDWAEYASILPQWGTHKPVAVSSNLTTTDG